MYRSTCCLKVEPRTPSLRRPCSLNEAKSGHGYHGAATPPEHPPCSATSPSAAFPPRNVGVRRVLDDHVLTWLPWLHSNISDRPDIAMGLKRCNLVPQDMAKPGSSRRSRPFQGSSVSAHQTLRQSMRNFLAMISWCFNTSGHSVSLPDVLRTAPSLCIRTSRDQLSHSSLCHAFS